MTTALREQRADPLGQLPKFPPAHPVASEFYGFARRVALESFCAHAVEG
jgi:hypothetical protein